MKRHHNLLSIALGLVATAASLSFIKPANAASFVFSAPNLFIGPPFNTFDGAFEATDSNLDGFLETTELSSFTASFQFTDTQTETWSLEDVQSFQMPAEGGFFISEGINDSGARFQTRVLSPSGLQTLTLQAPAPTGGVFSLGFNYGSNCESLCSGDFEATRVPIPEPTTVLLIFSLGILGLNLRHKK